MEIPVQQVTFVSINDLYEGLDELLEFFSDEKHSFTWGSCSVSLVPIRDAAPDIREEHTELLRRQHEELLSRITAVEEKNVRFVDLED